MYFLQLLRKFNLPLKLLVTFYTIIIQSVLCMSITVWFSSATKQDKARLERTIMSAERIIGADVPSIQGGNIRYRSRARRWTENSATGCHLLKPITFALTTVKVKKKR